MECTYCYRNDQWEKRLLDTTDELIELLDEIPDLSEQSFVCSYHENLIRITMMELINIRVDSTPSFNSAISIPESEHIQFDILSDPSENLVDLICHEKLMDPFSERPSFDDFFNHQSLNGFNALQEWNGINFTKATIGDVKKHIQELESLGPKITDISTRYFSKFKMTLRTRKPRILSKIDKDKWSKQKAWDAKSGNIQKTKLNEKQKNRENSEKLPITILPQSATEEYNENDSRLSISSADEMENENEFFMSRSDLIRKFYIATCPRGFSPQPEPSTSAKAIENSPQNFPVDAGEWETHPRMLKEETLDITHRTSVTLDSELYSMKQLQIPEMIKLLENSAFNFPSSSPKNNETDTNGCSLIVSDAQKKEIKEELIMSEIDPINLPNIENTINNPKPLVVQSIDFPKIMSEFTTDEELPDQIDLMDYIEVAQLHTPQPEDEPMEKSPCCSPLSIIIDDQEWMRDLQEIFT